MKIKNLIFLIKNYIQFKLIVKIKHNNMNLSKAIINY